ncbi:hypothetical protein [Dielma fastidiosa]|uniref:Uncharacterized protein n=1 Tax=Dielma fastidiosa TaxID=1034346 RepID=A0AB35US81_9FIRM|nr:hypothetical protein [Dielma fastidiosa]MDY5167965.1 hypothetical protein [Dielma fastidiosa]
MNLIITSVTIVDLTNKEAKKIEFSESKNLLTSEHNHLGKSVIMKSIYYTLGAEVYFPNPIKAINLLTYLDFFIGDIKYRVCRLNRIFTLYQDGKFVKKFTSVGDFGNALEEIFKLEINLVGKDDSGTITKCPPAFYYMPYYIDQENGWAANSFSFDRMNQFDLPQRKNSYFFHLGVLDNAYVEKSKSQKINERRIAQLIKENEKLTTVIETLRIGLDDTQMSFDADSLERAISTRQEKVKKILDEIAKSRNALVEAEDNYIQLTHDKDVLAKYIKKKQPLNDNVEKDIVECPRCGMFFERSMTQKLEKMYLIESLHDDYTSISNDINNLEKRIEKLKKTFLDKQNSLQYYEKTLADNQETYNAYLKSKATNQLLVEYQTKIGTNISEIERLDKNNSEIRKELSSYNAERTQANNIYLSNLSKLLIDLDVPKDQVGEKSEPGTALVASGAYGPRCKVAQMLAFLQTQKKACSEIISFPLVIDSPNALEQDSEHLDSVIRTLLTWNKTDNQIIVASIGGKETANAISNVKIILLDNPQNHLFSKNEYSIYEKEISEIFTSF